jgi:ribosomal protein S2
VPIFDVMQTYNKIKLAARVIAAVKNPQDVIVSACLTR